MVSFRIIVAAVLWVLAWSTSIPAIDFPSRDVRIDGPFSSVPKNSSSPVLSVDQNNNVYAAWEDNRNGPKTIFFNHRFPEGGWESNSMALTTGNPKSQDVEQGDATDPQICSDNNGHIYVVWVDNRSVKAGTGRRDIYLRYSKDYGVSWLPEFIDYRLDTDTPHAGHSIEPQIACDDDGYVYVVWRDSKNGAYDVYFRSLHFVFQSPVDLIQPQQFPDVRLNVGQINKPISAGSFNALSPKIAADDHGDVHVAWEDTREVPDQEIYPGIYFNVSRNHGATWRAEDIRIDHRPIGGGPLHSIQPRIAVDNTGRVHVIWLDNAGRRPLQPIDAAGFNKLFYNNSLDFGNTWSFTDDLRLSDVPKTTEVRDAAISANNRGEVYVAWTDNSEGATSDSDSSTTTNQNPLAPVHLFFNHSENSGFTWLNTRDKIRLDSGDPDTDSQNPRVINDGFRSVFVAWEEEGRSTFQGTIIPTFRNLHFNVSSERGRKSTWLERDIRSSTGHSSALQFRTDNNGTLHLVWQDDRNSAGNFDIYYNSFFFDVFTLTKGARVGEACFIATAAYGSPWEPHVLLLRNFRDRFLLPNIPGRTFVSLYYRLSPPLARFLNSHPSLKPAVRISLLPFVGLATVCLKTTILEKAGGGIVILILVVFSGKWIRRRRHSQPQ